MWLLHRRHRTLRNPDDRGPLRVMFVNTSLPVGGAETLLVNLIRRMDRERFVPEVCCLKEPGPIGDMLSSEVPVFSALLKHKFDFAARKRLTRLFHERAADAVVTVGAGDKMFWGRLAAARAGVPVILAALHSTGYPDGIERPNRWLTPITDGFIAVASTHGRYLVEQEGFPAGKVFVIPNGIDIFRFRPDLDCTAQRAELGLAGEHRLVAIVAALRPEKNHELFLQAAARVRGHVPGARFAIIGDGPRRSMLEALARQLHLSTAVHFLGNRRDIPQWLNLCDVFALSSQMEANPVSMLEAMACGRPVVAPQVGSIPDALADGQNGFLVPPNDEVALAARIQELLFNGPLRREMGRHAREFAVCHASLKRMVDGYQNLIEFLYRRRLGLADAPRPKRVRAMSETVAA